MPENPTVGAADSAEVRLVGEALRRPPLVWSPLVDGITKCFTPYVIPKDPERPFGIARRLPCGRWEEQTGYEEPLTRRGRLVDAAGGLISDYRISHYWRPDENPNADRCLLCGDPNANHPDYDHTQDTIQCLVIRRNVLDPPATEHHDRLRRLMHHLTTRDLEALLAELGATWDTR